MAWISFSEATLETEAAVFSSKLAGGRISGAETDFSWRLVAEDLVVNWTKASALEVGKPSNPRDWLYRKANDPTYGQQAFSDVTASSSRRDDNSYVLLNRSSAASLRLGASNLHIRPIDSPSWEIVTRAPLATPKVILSSGSLDVHSNGGLTKLTGDFSFHVWAAAVVVKANGRNHSFDSGPDSADNQLLVRSREFQLLRLDVEDGTLEITTGRSGSSWAVVDLGLDGRSAIQFSHAKGTLFDYDRRTEVDGPLLSVAGPLRFRAWNSSSDQARPLSAEIESIPQAFVVAREGHAVVHAPNPTMPRPDLSRNPSGPIVGTLAVFLLGAPFLLAARNQVRVDDVEFALLTRRPARARRLAARFLRKRRNDANAAFLFGVACLAERRPRLLISRLEPLAIRMQGRGPASLAFLLAIAAAREGDTKRSGRWAAEAACDQRFAARLKGMGIKGETCSQDDVAGSLASYA